MGKIVKMSFEGKNFMEMGKWTEIYDSEKMDPGAGLPPPRGNRHVY